MAALPDWSRELAPGAWGMLDNDQIGDGTIAAIGHAVALWRSYAPPMTFMTDAEAITAYSAVSGYVPGNAATDKGVLLKSALDYWMNPGIVAGGKLDKLGGFTPLDWKDHQAVTDAVEKDGCVICGVILRIAQAINQEPVWQTIDSPIAGGHCVLIVKITDQGPVCVTWGQLVQITWDWWDACTDEAYGLSTPDWTLK
jgi:hypothetical protein